MHVVFLPGGGGGGRLESILDGMFFEKNILKVFDMLNLYP